MSCTCQQCKKEYRVDLIVPNKVWEKIKPKSKVKGAGLLCGSCMMAKIEAFGKYGVLKITNLHWGTSLPNYITRKSLENEKYFIAREFFLKPGVLR